MTRRFLLMALLALLVAGLASATDPDWSFAVMGDPQYLTGASYSAHVQSIIDHQASNNIKFVLCLGDVLNGDDSGQRADATAAFGLLDAAGIPWMCVHGNHDMLNANVIVSPRSSGLQVHFLAGGFFSAGVRSSKSHWNTTLPGGGGTITWGAAYDEQNWCFLVQVGGQHIIVFGLELYPRGVVMDWATGMQALYPGYAKIAVTHAHLRGDGVQFPHDSGADPLLTATAPTNANSGTEMWANWFTTWTDLRFIFNGHYYNSPYGYSLDWARLASTGAGGNTVQQVFHNPQWNTPNTPAASAYVERQVGLLTIRPSLGTAEWSIFSTIDTKWQQVADGSGNALYDVSRAVLFSVPWSQGPAISNIRVDGITHTGARVQWTTDVASSGGRVEYDSTTATPPFAFSTSGTAEGFALVSIYQWARPADLAPATAYNYRVCSTANATEVCSAVQTAFTTAAAPVDRFRNPTLPTPVVVPAMPASYTATYAESCATVQGRINTLATLNNTNDYLVTLPAGGTCTDTNVNAALGNHPTIDLPARACSSCGYIVLATSAYASAAFPAEGVLFDPAVWDSAQVATLTGVNGTTGFVLTWSGSKYRLVGIKVLTDGLANVSTVNMATGDDNIIDRIWVQAWHGKNTPAIDLGYQSSHVSRTAVVNSYIYDIQVDPAFAYGINAVTARGVLIQNNYINAPGISVFAPGGLGTVPGVSDMTLRRNLMEWDAAAIGAARQSFEVKQSKRLLIEGNVIRNQWAGGIVGSSNPVITMTTATSDYPIPGTYDSVNVIEDTTIRGNTVYHVPGFLQVFDKSCLGVNRTLLEHNIVYGVDGHFAAPTHSATGMAMALGSGIEDLEVRYNTMWDFRSGIDGGSFSPFLVWSDVDRSAGVKIHDNVYTFNAAPATGLIAVGNTGAILPTAITTNGWTKFTSLLARSPGDQTSTIFSNLIVPGVTNSSVGANYADASKRVLLADCTTYLTPFPANTCFPGVGATPAGTLANVQFQDAANGNFHWRYNSPYVGQASTGASLGADAYTVSVMQGLIFSVRQIAGTIYWDQRDVNTQCYLDSGATANYGTRTATTPGTRMNSVALPGGTHYWRLQCGNAMDGATYGSAVYTGTL
jgi:hypothetical protein